MGENKHGRWKGISVLWKFHGQRFVRKLRQNIRYEHSFLDNIRKNHCARVAGLAEGTKLCPEWGSNSQPSDYETDALPTALSRLWRPPQNVRKEVFGEVNKRLLSLICRVTCHYLLGLPHYMTLISSRLPHYQIKRPPSMTTNEPQTNVHPWNHN